MPGSDPMEGARNMRGAGEPGDCMCVERDGRQRRVSNVHSVCVSGLKSIEGALDKNDKKTVRDV